MIITATHDLAQAYQFSDHIIIMNQGKVLGLNLR